MPAYLSCSAFRSHSCGLDHLMEVFAAGGHKHVPSLGMVHLEVPETHVCPSPVRLDPFFERREIFLWRLILGPIAWVKIG